MVILAAPGNREIPISEHDDTTAHPTTAPIAEPSEGWGTRSASSLSAAADAEGP